MWFDYSIPILDSALFLINAYCMQGNFGTGKMWQMTTNLPIATFYHPKKNLLVRKTVACRLLVCRQVYFTMYF